MRAPLGAAPATAAVIAAVRETVEGPGADRYLAPEIQAVVDAIRTDRLLEAVERVTGPLS
jgi:histidine ammonia-lyase